MIEHCLYGLGVFSEFPLFQSGAPMSSAAPGVHRPLQLRAMPEHSPRYNAPVTIPLHWAHDRELYLHSDRELACSVAGQPWRFEVKSVLSISWIGGDPAVYFELEPAGSRELLVFWFVHIFLPLYLTLERGQDFIHSAAVEIGDRPVLFLAPSTGGKSTLGDYFLRQGHPMLSDDKVATMLYRGEFYALPSHPHHRPFRQYEVLGNPVSRYAIHPRPIHAIYLLQKGSADCAVSINEVRGFRKFEQLLPHYLYSFPFMQKQRLQWLAQLVDRTPVFSMRRPWNLDRLHDSYTALCRHSSGLPLAAAPDVREVTTVN